MPSLFFLPTLLLFLLFLNSSTHLICNASDSITPTQPLSGTRTITSKGGIFELGFFTPSNSSQRHYIGIWYKQVPEKTIVWVANRETPLPNTANSLLKLSEDGNLALLGPSNSSIWTTKFTSKPPSSNSKSEPAGEYSSAPSFLARPPVSSELYTAVFIQWKAGIEDLRKKLEQGLVPDAELKKLISIQLGKRLQSGYKPSYEEQLAQVLELANSAVREWKLKYPTSKIDDCAVVCLYLDGKMDSESKAVESISGITGAAVRIHPPELIRSSDEQNPPRCLQHSFTISSAQQQRQKVTEMRRTPPRIPNIIMSKAAFEEAALSLHAKLNAFIHMLHEAACGKDLNTFLPASFRQGSVAVLKAGEDIITVKWGLNGTMQRGVDSQYKKVKNRGWRKTDYELSKDKTCQLEIIDRPYTQSNKEESIDWMIKKVVPTATYFVRAYAVYASGKEI
ncbi:hypothetical protein ACLOJK_020628 [Asimina triloba]